MSLPATGFYFLRHGETDWNAQGLSQGNVDIPLNPNGVAQAHAAAAVLQGRGIASVVCSPLGRARDTAGIVAAALGLAVVVQDDLREVSFGAHEGAPMAGTWFAEWIAGEMTPDRAESFAELRMRACTALTTALAHPAPVLAVAHGALFRALRAEMGLPPDVRTPNGVPFWCDPGSPWTLTALEGT